MLRRVAIVDDDPMTPELLLEAVGSESATAIVATGPELLQDIDDGQRFDALLCSTRIPGMPTSEFYEAIRSRASEQADRILFISAAVTSHVTTALSDGTPHIVIGKSIRAGELRSVLESFFALGRALERVQKPRPSAKWRQYGRILASATDAEAEPSEPVRSRQRTSSTESQNTLLLEEAIAAQIRVVLVLEKVSNAEQSTVHQTEQTITGTPLALRTEFDKRERVVMRIDGEDLVQWVAVDTVLRVVPAGKA